MSKQTVEKSFELAKEIYAEQEIDVVAAMSKLKKVPLSLHCWQTDDVGGFETPDAVLAGGGIQVTGNFPGKARSIAEMRADLEMAYSLIPGNHRLNLHAIYGEFQGKKVDRDAIGPEHFKGWADWAKKNKIKLDFNASNFSHPKANGGFTLSSKDKAIREFWIEHNKRCREITAYFGKEQKSPSVHNVWIPDGMKDIPVDRMGYRANLLNSLDEIFKIELPANQIKDAVESKVFGIGAESFTVGSHEFYMGYALTRKKMLCLDLGHFHLTESIADKLSSIYQYQDEVLFHVSRPVRWDSDHVVILNDEVRALGEELVRCGKIDKAYIGLDFFDATVNRTGAYALGARSMLKSLLLGFLEPTSKLKSMEAKGDYFSRLATLELLKTLPFGAVWDKYCIDQNVPTEAETIQVANDYQKKVVKERK